MAQKVTPKKHLGQHFLADEGIAQDIVQALVEKDADSAPIEIGPGMGVLTKYLAPIYGDKLNVFEIDEESVNYLIKNKVLKKEQVFGEDFLKANLKELLPSTFNLIGNLPYNISSPIFFRLLEYKSSIPYAVCMVQKEVGERIASLHGTKKYGILSVLTQAFYKVEYLFTVPPDVFVPPPKVDSGVIRFERFNETLPCNERLFFTVVKACFGTRRKTLRNSLKRINAPVDQLDGNTLGLRPEQMSVADFIQLTCDIERVNGE